jgi:hypothetical protein
LEESRLESLFDALNKVDRCLYSTWFKIEVIGSFAEMQLCIRNLALVALVELVYPDSHKELVAQEMIDVFK